jgi:hypothetical protein
MTEGIKTIIIPVRDLAAAKALYGTALDVEPYADEPYYVGFRVGDQEIGLDPNGHNHGMTGPSATATSTTSRRACARPSTRAGEPSRTSRTSAEADWPPSSRTPTATSWGSSRDRRSMSRDGWTEWR